MLPACLHASLLLFFLTLTLSFLFSDALLLFFLTTALLFLLLSSTSLLFSTLARLFLLGLLLGCLFCSALCSHIIFARAIIGCTATTE